MIKFSFFLGLLFSFPQFIFASTNAPAAKVCALDLKKAPRIDRYAGADLSVFAQELLLDQSWVLHFWEANKVFAYDPTVARENVFVVDTPPPTLSGDLHIGHLASFMQADVYVRYQRLMGKHIYFPIGWDSNGEPTYKRVNKAHGPYLNGKKLEQATQLVIAEDNAKNTAIMKDAGLSVDWALTYNTLDRNSQITAQSAFLELQRRGEAYFHPTELQWRIRLQENIGTIRKAAQDLLWLPLPRENAAGEPITKNYQQSMFEPWLAKIDRDWTITRDQKFGLPVPLWYRLDAKGEVTFENPIFALPEQLLVDPLKSPPPGFSESQRATPNGFAGETRFFSTWMTSALTTLIQSRWGQVDAQRRDLYPADFRWQGSDILHNWLVYSLLSTHLLTGEAPFKKLYINGIIINDHNEKMSKSLENGVSARHLLDTYPSDFIRQTAINRNLGKQTSVFGAEPPLTEYVPLRALLGKAHLLKQTKGRHGFTRSAAGVDPKFAGFYGFVRRAMNQIYQVMAEDYRTMNYQDVFVQIKSASDILSLFCHGLSPMRMDRDAEVYFFMLDLFKDLLKAASPVMPFATELAWQELRDPGDLVSVHSARWPSLGSEPEVEDLAAVIVIISNLITGPRGSLEITSEDYTVTVRAPADLLARLQQNALDINLRALLQGRESLPPREIHYEAITDNRELRRLKSRMSVKGIQAGFTLTTP